MMDYLKVNKEGWNQRTKLHVESDFYDMDSFKAGKTSLKEIELGLLGDISGLTILHLQCHFGQDSISLAKMGAQVTAVDLSPDAIEKAKDLAKEMNVEVEFICSDVLAEGLLEGREFDMVYATYGTIPWLPELDKWSSLVKNRLKKGGRLLFIEFHPVIDMYDDDMKELQYSYFNVAPIKSQSSSYAEKSSVDIPYIVWNHPFSEIFKALLGQGLHVEHFDEYPYSPYPCFNGMIANGKGRYIIERFGDKMPLCFSLIAIK